MSAKSNNSKTLYIVIGVVLFLLVAGILVATLSSKGTKTTTNTKTTSKAPEPTTTPKVASRCIDVPKTAIDSIQSGYGTTGLTITNSKAVQSKDFNKVYFVAAEVDGAGLEGKGDVAVFATNSLEPFGMVDSVNATAKAYFVFPDASKSDAKITINDDGVNEAIKCLN